MQVDMTSEGRPALRASAGALSMTAGIVHVLLAAQHVDWAADLRCSGRWASRK